MRVVVAALLLALALPACSDCGQGISIGCDEDADCPRGFVCSAGTCERSSGSLDGAAATDASTDGQVVVPDAANPDATAPDSAPADALLPDSAVADQAAPADHATADSAPVDAWTDAISPDLLAGDTASPDTQLVDAAAPDAAGPDATGEDAPALDSASTDLGAPDSWAPDLLSEDSAGWILCPGIATPQLDTDGDGIGDDCDNCPAVDNPGQGDADGDDMGDACDGCAADPAKTAPGLCGCGAVDSSADTDLDTVRDCLDNCPDDYNLLQEDDDADAIGDACDPCTDTDGDGYGDLGYLATTCTLDNCPDDANPGQEDGDWDGLGDICDPRPSSAALQFTTTTGPVTGCGVTSLASDGTRVWFLCGVLKRLFSSTNVAAGWDEKASPATMGEPDQVRIGSMMDAAMAYDPGGQRLISSRWFDSTLSGTSDWEKERVALYHVPSDTWTLIRTSPPAEATHGHVVLGASLYAIQGSGGLPLKRFELTSITPTQYVEFSSDIPALGLDADVEDSSHWLGRAAKTAALGGYIWVIKNDWYTAPAGDGDKLMRFAPADFVDNGLTNLARVADLPFEPGAGSALVALPAGWAGLGAQGGLLIIAGESPSNHEGFGTKSDMYAIYDVASGTFGATAQLPSVLGGGTSAAFHRGRVIIKVGDNYQFWTLRPIPN